MLLPVGWRSQLELGDVFVGGHVQGSAVQLPQAAIVCLSFRRRWGNPRDPWGQSQRGRGREPDIAREQWRLSPFSPPPSLLRAPDERTGKGLAWDGIETCM